jgi:hypothetical protein
LDVDIAREIALDVQQNQDAYQGLDEDQERHILKLIEKANRDLS